MEMIEAKLEASIVKTNAWTWFLEQFPNADRQAVLKPRVIFKCKTMPKIKTNMVLNGQQNHENLDRKSLSLSSWRSKSANLLVLDSSEAQKMEHAKYLLKSENMHLAVIPGRLCLSKPFKDRVRQRWMAWMAEGIHELFTGRQKKPSDELINFCQ